MQFCNKINLLLQDEVKNKAKIGDAEKADSEDKEKKEDSEYC